MGMKSNIHRKLFHPDYFGWHWYCKNAARRQRRDDKQMAKKAARKNRKAEIRAAEEVTRTD